MLCYQGNKAIYVLGCNENDLLFLCKSVMPYGIIFWGNSHISGSIFKVQKRIIRIITKAGKRNSCRQLYKQLQILPLPSLYIFSILVFANNRSLFLSNSEIHDRNTRYNHNLHLSSTNLTMVQKGVLHSGSNIYNHLPLHITMLSKDAKQFKSKLRSHLIEHTFYSLGWILSINILMYCTWLLLNIFYLSHVSIQTC